VRSARLVEALWKREGEFDAILAGPFLLGLTADVARAFPARTLLVPCFHDEPLARLRIWHWIYDEVGGGLYHSPDEQTLAEAEFGITSPGGICVGTFLDTEFQGNARRGKEHVGTGRRYLLYAGRYLAEKGVPLLLEYAQRYGEAHAERFTFAFMGQGPVYIPRAPWIRDLGFVDEPVKRDVMAGAAALVHLSPHESLSLVALEAWVQGVPVLAEARSEVLAGHLRRGGGGQAVGSYEEFAAALDDLWQHPPKWQ